MIAPVVVTGRVVRGTLDRCWLLVNGVDVVVEGTPGTSSHPKNCSVDRHAAEASHSVLFCTLEQMRGSQLKNAEL